MPEATGTARTLTRQDLDILGRYARGEALKQIAIALRCPDRTVSALITGIKFNRQYARQLVESHDARLLAAHAPDPAPQPPAPAPRPEPTMPDTTPAVDGIDDLLTRAVATGNRKAIQLADRIRADLDTLATLVARLDQEATARAEIGRLEAQLAAAREQLAAISAPAGGPTPAEYRAWARAAGIACPAMGRIPSTVVTAYQAAHGGGA